MMNIATNYCFTYCTLEPYSSNYNYHPNRTCAFIEEFPKMYYQLLKHQSPRIELFSYSKILKFDPSDQATMCFIFLDPQGHLTYRKYEYEKLMCEIYLSRSSIDPLFESITIGKDYTIACENLKNGSHRIHFLSEDLAEG